MQTEEEKMYKRWIALLLAVAVCAGALCGCAGVPNEHETALTQEWERILDAYDTMFAAVNWAAEYARAFAGDNSWESLMKARAAALSARQTIQGMELPQDTLSEQMYAALLDDGIEADVVSLEREGLEQTQALYLGLLEQMVYLLRDDVFLQASFDSIHQWTDLAEEMVAREGEYLCLTTNYLLLQLEDQSLWQNMAGEYPAVFACGTLWLEDFEEIQRGAEEALNAMEDAETMYQQLLGGAEYTLALVMEAVESGDVSALASRIHVIEGVPAWLPMPAWVGVDADWYYMFPAEGADPSEKAVTGQPLTVPDSCLISCPGITLEQARDYAVRLEEWGLAPYSAWDEAQENWQMLVSIGESTLFLSWSAERTALYLTEPVGCLIPELYLTAMLSR